MKMRDGIAAAVIPSRDGITYVSLKCDACLAHIIQDMEHEMILTYTLIQALNIHSGLTE